MSAYVPDLPSGVDILTAALGYAGAGLYLAPVMPGTKNPGSVLGSGWPEKTSRDPQVIAAWLAGTDHGIAVHAGRSGVVVVDVDHPEKVPPQLAAACATAPYQATRPDQPGRGHYLFLQPPGRDIGNGLGRLAGGWGDIRGRNGVIVVAPTPHPDGGEYRWERTGAIPVLPAEIADLLDDAADPVDAASDAEVGAFLDAHTAGRNTAAMDALLRAFDRKAAAGTSRHQAALGVAVSLAEEAAVGAYPARTAFEALRDRFVAAVTHDGHGQQGPSRTDAEAAAEYAGIARYAVGKAAAADPAATRERLAAKAPAAPAVVLPPHDTPGGADPAAEGGDSATASTYRPAVPDVQPVTLAEAVATFRKWLHLPDIDPLLAIAAAAVANRTDDATPVWLIILGPPSSGKTEQIIGLRGLPETIEAATITEASLLSGTAKKERTKDATGGILREVGAYGLIVMKDFTSVLSQNGDTRSLALAALREVFDGAWTRPLGVDGARRLHWEGKAGLIAGCTNAYDQHSAVIAELGDRFLAIRIADDDTDPDPEARALSIGLAALAHGDGGEQAMRSELTAALSGLIIGADTSRTHRALSDTEKMELIRLARYAGVSRTPVKRNPYTGDLLAVPEPEGPGRVVISLRQLLGGLEAIGVSPDDRWRVLRRIATDTGPALRGRVTRALVADETVRRTSDIALAAGLITKTARRVLDDLAMIGFAEHTKKTDADTSPDLWAPTPLLRRLWPETGTEIDVGTGRRKKKERGRDGPGAGTPTEGRLSLSQFEAGPPAAPADPPRRPDASYGEPPPKRTTGKGTRILTCPHCGKPETAGHAAECKVRRPW